MRETARKYTVKCSEPGCDNFYNSRGLCSKHYKRLLGKEGGYARDYTRVSKNDSYKKMKSESDKLYREKLRKNGLLTEKYRADYLKSISTQEKIDAKKARAKDYHLRTKLSRREIDKAYQRRYRDELKLKVLTHYSNGKLECANCGIPVYSVLTLDHIDNTGADHKRRLSHGGKASSSKIYKDVIDNNYPPNYQVLCFNCNFHKEFMRRCDMI